ncbi:hepatocyte growth factor activator isoform X1 [Oncorhynchus nerka]|uniref:hepatocyte growth factor activator isoform X1 n=1 Tax=Oncorhynchus nerka TaxID=8023 RepID=UPI001131672F|nr:hepatocyte growth factor activator-like isoform X1 [Oncorhynchus nerka]
MMLYFVLLFLPYVLSVRTRMVLPGYETLRTRNGNENSHKVLTVDRKECKFPFRQGGSIHHHCITISSSRPWCSLTHNFDRDFLWGYCAAVTTQPSVFVHSSRRFTDLCQVNPCQNGGICTLVPHRRSFECSCPENFTGRHCDQRKCYETIHLRYYDIGESWGRIYLRNVERCTCVNGEISCERVRYTVCSENPCENDGTCRLITATREEVCACRPGYSGPYCSIAPEVECYDNKGTDYRGVVNTTVSGALCLPWNSDLLHDELHMGTVERATLRGLGEHSYCRNPDGDKMPWCYTLNDRAISWENCDVPSCVMRSWGNEPLVKSKMIRRASSRRVVQVPRPPPPPNVLPDTNQTNDAKPAKKPVCGKRHKKRISVAKGRILGGSSALPGTHPWMAALYIGDDSFCAGTLVSSCWVVSAAHCFFRSPLVSKIRVILGQLNFNVTTSDTKTFGVEKYIFPGRFSVFNPTLHDIVLVKLKKQDGHCVRRTQFIQPICLPDKAMTFPDYYCCQITGWGHMHEKANKYSNLQEAGVRIFPFERCIQPEVYGNHVTSNMVCAGTDRCVDACQGDSGGPLACVKDDVSFLYGVISWGDGCGKTGKPGVYTKVVSYVNWINTIIKRKPKSK